MNAHPLNLEPDGTAAWLDALTARLEARLVEARDVRARFTRARDANVWPDLQALMPGLQVTVRV